MTRQPYFRPSEEDGSLSCPDCAATFAAPTTKKARAMVRRGLFDSLEDALTKGALRAAQDHWQAEHAEEDA